MLYYIIFTIILATILLAFFINLIHSSYENFRKKLKLIFLVILLVIVGFIMTRFPQVISVIPAIFLILYRWSFLINFFAKIFLMKNFKHRNFSKNIDKKEALEILGLNKNASKNEILKRYQDLMKINHPDKGGSEWITKKLNQARETLLG
tara:strand:- start:39 stop:488 length:450 start_codon:yes stop_codon:yes gene_type:complete